MKIRHALVLAAAVAMPLMAAAPAGAAPNPAAACNDGGFVNFRNPATGQPYNNQGQCVSTVAKGGTLVPVAPVTQPTARITFTPRATSDSDHPNGYTTCDFGVVLTDFAPGSVVTLQTIATLPSGQVSGPITRRGVVVGADGTVSIFAGTSAPPNAGYTGSVTVIDAAGTVLATSPTEPVACSMPDPQPPVTPTYTSVQGPFTVEDGQSFMELGMWCGEGDTWKDATGVIIPEGATYKLDPSMQKYAGTRAMGLTVDLSTATDPALRDGGFRMSYTVVCEDTALPTGY